VVFRCLLGLRSPVSPGEADTSFEVCGHYHYVEQGYYAGNPTYGLPASGTIVSASNTPTKVATFQLQPFNSTNIVKFDGTLTLTTQSRYENISFLVNSLSANAPASFTLNFSTGPSTTFTTSGNVPYPLSCRYSR
jgi:hypothetical protein